MTTVFLHGLGQTPESWQPVITKLPEGDYRCPSFSELLRGQEVCYEKLYAALEDYCGKIDGEFCLCGLSLGAELALHYALEHSQRLSGLVLIACQYKMPKLLLSIQNVLFRLMPEKNFHDLGFGKEDFTRLCVTTGQQDFSNGLETIRCPSLILCGEKDGANKKASLGLSRRIPGSKLFILPKSSHEVNKDAPETLAQLLREFWSEIE